MILLPNLALFCKRSLLGVNHWNSEWGGGIVIFGKKKILRQENSLWKPDLKTENSCSDTAKEKNFEHKQDHPTLRSVMVCPLHVSSGEGEVKTVMWLADWADKNIA